MAKIISKTEFKQYKLKEVFQKNLSRMEQNETYKKEQHDLAEADFLKRD